MVGACFGSFLSVCIWRIPRGESVVRPRSHCPSCGKLIPWYRNLPIASWLALRGRCADCKAKISPRYLLLELLTAALFAGAAWRFAFDPTLVLLAGVVVFGLELGAFVDLDWYILPDRVTVGGIVLGLCVSALVPRIHGCALYHSQAFSFGHGPVRTACAAHDRSTAPAKHNIFAVKQIVFMAIASHARHRALLFAKFPDRRTV